jgi:hypothetical protein
VFVLDSLFISGLRWVLNTIVTAAESEMNDDTALRDQLLAAEMRRELGEISDEEFAEIEADLLARIRDVKTRREGTSGPIAFSGRATDAGSGTFAVEATVTGDFHEPAGEAVAFPAEPVTAGDSSGTVIEGSLIGPARGRRRTLPTRPVRRTSAARASGARRTSRTRTKIR